MATIENAIEINEDIADELKALDLDYEYGEISMQELAERSAELIRQHIILNNLTLIHIYKD